MKKTTHADLVSSVLCWLQIFRPTGYFYKTNTGGFAGEYKGKKRFVRFGVPGLADITGTLDGRTVYVECKIPPDKPTPEQLEFRRCAERAGALYVLAYSIEDVEKAIDGA